MVDAVLHLKDGWQKHALAKGLFTEAELCEAQAKAHETGRDVADIFLQTGKLTEEQLAQLKAEVAGLVYVDVLDYQIDPRVLELVPEPLARKHTLLPLYRVGNSLTVAMRDPWNAVGIDEVRLSAKVSIVRPILGTTSAIRKAIDRHYGHRVVEEAAKSTSGPKTTSQATTGRLQRVPSLRTAELSAEVSVTKLVDALFTEALEAKASDIHLEPEQDQLRIRYRIDGVLQEIKLLPVNLHEAVASRIKLLAKLDITEHRLPQDGHLPLTVDGRLIDLRISTYPTVFGENIVIRLLDHGSLNRSLDGLGFSPQVLAEFTELVQRPHGIVLVTGPTGSGKTTTLYAALGHINSVSKNIMTIEDPVEYRMPLIRQTQINVKAGVTFTAGLRSLLRQDPDVIMVGEIRDRDTAEIAIHAALTGHLVLSTLHTNDAAATVARLLEMGIEPYLVTSTLLGVAGQRLVRSICSHCREEVAAGSEIRKRYPDVTVVFQGQGCRFCRKVGFLGRIGIFELFRVNERIKELIGKQCSSEELKRVAVAAGMRTMHMDGIAKVQQGLTTIEELDRVAPDEGAV